MGDGPGASSGGRSPWVGGQDARYQEGSNPAAVAPLLPRAPSGALSPICVHPLPHAPPAAPTSQVSPTSLLLCFENFKSIPGWERLQGPSTKGCLPGQRTPDRGHLGFPTRETEAREQGSRRAGNGPGLTSDLVLGPLCLPVRSSRGEGGRKGCHRGRGPESETRHFLASLFPSGEWANGECSERASFELESTDNP